MGLPGSGATTVVYNTRERVVSDDPNRAQAKAAQGIANVLRFLLDAQNDQDVSGGGLEVLGDGTETPLRATVISGLRPQPELGTVNCFVAPGCVLLIDNASPGDDDSLAAFVTDPGVQLSGALTLTPGAGSIRIDVLECQRVTNVFESDNRDIFNVSTGLFTPSQVTKISGGKLVYRLRLGTPGSGFPGVVAGWLPLMVASVPAGATTWDVVTCWDVRPLATDRANGPVKTTRLWENASRALLNSDVTTDVTKVNVLGGVDATFRGYKAGGELKASSAAQGIDITAVANQSAAFGGFGTTGLLWYLYLVYPFGLPRWVRYNDFPNVRVPGALRGIPAVSSAPCQFSGHARSNQVNTPAIFGLLDATSDQALCIAVGRGPVTGGQPPLGVMGDGTSQMLVNEPSAVVQLSPTSNTTTTIKFTFTDDTHMSGNARAIWVRLFAEFQMPNPGTGAVGVGHDFGFLTLSNGNALAGYSVPIGVLGGAQTFVDSDASGTGSTPGVAFDRDFVVRIPLTPTFNGNPSARTYVLSWFHNFGVIAVSPFAAIKGWELGP